MANEAGIAQWNNPNFINFWKNVEPSVNPLTAPLFGALAPKPGERILDVGCGGGLTTLQAAAMVGAEGRASGVDISEPLLALARERAKESATANVDFLLADAQTADIAGAPFSAAISRLGVMFFADPTAAFANIRRHVAEGGRLVFVCFQSTAANPWYPAPILAKYAPPMPPSPYLPPSPFALGEEDRTRRILEGAGWANVSFTPFVDLWDAPSELTSGRAMLGPFNLPPERQAAALAELDEHEKRMSPDGRDRNERHMWVVQARNG
jgi:ubiquinone/menaquinone biosynthesis C-methylase UbiE